MRNVIAAVLLLALPGLAFGAEQDSRIFTKDGKYLGRVREDSPSQKTVLDKYGNEKFKVRTYGTSRESIITDQHGNVVGKIRK